MPLLAQNSQTSDLFLPTLMVMAIIALLIGAIAIIRKKMLSTKDDDIDAMGGLSLSNLRQMVRERKMTQEEFDAAKSQIVARTQRASEKQNPAKNPAPDIKIDPDQPL